MTAFVIVMILTAGILIGFVLGGAVVNYIHRHHYRSELGDLWVQYRSRSHDR